MDKYSKAIETKRIKYWKPYPDWFVNLLKNPDDKRRAVEGFMHGEEKLVFHCPVHNVDYTQRVGDAIKRGTGLPRKTGCHQCSEDKKKATKIKNGNINIRPQWFIDDLMYEEDKYKARMGTLSSFQKLWFVCPKGHEYEQWGYDHILGDSPKCGCPVCNCGSHRGKVEVQLCEWLASITIVIPNTRKVIQSPTGRPMELDMYCPDINLAIEVDGEYWHEEYYDTYEEYLEDLSNNDNGYRLKKWKGYHQWKDDQCASKGITLVHVDPSKGFDICKEEIEKQIYFKEEV